MVLCLLVFIGQQIRVETPSFRGLSTLSLRQNEPSLQVVPGGLCTTTHTGLVTVQAACLPGEPHLCLHRALSTLCLPHPFSPRVHEEPVLNGHWLNGCDAGSRHALGLCVINQNRVEAISWTIGFVLGKMGALLTSAM